MTASPSPSPWIRRALTIFPLGLILLGAASFVFYFNKREQAQQRAIRYASGLRVDLNEAELKRYGKVFTDTLAKPATEHAAILATFIESTLGPENMGYTVRRVLDKSNNEAPPLALEVEVTGTQKPRDVTLVLCGFLPQMDTIDHASIARPASALLSLAHAMTGLAKVRTIRFVAVQNTKAIDAYFEQGINAQDRVSHVLLLGPLTSASDQEVLKALHLEGRGVLLLRPTIAPGDTVHLLDSAKALQQQVTALADRL